LKEEGENLYIESYDAWVVVMGKEIKSRADDRWRLEPARQLLFSRVLYAPDFHPRLGGGLSNLIVKPHHFQITFWLFLLLTFKTKSTLAYSVFSCFFLPWSLIYGLRIMSEFLFHSNSFFLGPFPIQC